MKRRNVTGVSTAGGREVGSRDRGRWHELQHDGILRKTQDTQASERGKVRRGEARQGKG